VENVHNCNLAETITNKKLHCTGCIFPSASLASQKVCRSGCRSNQRPMTVQRRSSIIFPTS